MKYQQHAVIGLGGGDLEEATVRRERVEPPFLAGDSAAMLKVPFIPHDYNRRRAGQLALGLSDALHLLPYHVEAGPVTDAVNQDESVCPLQLSVADVARALSILKHQIDTTC